MKRLTKVNIWHGVFCDNRFTDVSTPFLHYLKKKLKKFKEKFGSKYILYTIGHTAWYNINCISIVHPYDTFKPKVGEDIVKGRIKRMMGEIPNRAPYNPIPEYIYINEM